MSKKPIIIISGEPYSIFFEILFKVYKSNFLKDYKYPIIIIGSKKVMENQMRFMKYNIEINLMHCNIKITVDSGLNFFSETF